MIAKCLREQEEEIYSKIIMMRCASAFMSMANNWCLQGELICYLTIHRNLVLSRKPSVLKLITRDRTLFIFSLPIALPAEQ